MKKTLIVANWKENLTAPQANGWIEEFGASLSISRSRSKLSNPKSQIPNDVEIVICPAFVLIPVLKPQASSLKPRVCLGAQDVSKFEEGQYTGEVSAKMLKGYVKYVIVGHSERRKYFGETDEDVAKKSILVLKHNLVPIVCVSDIEEARRWKVEVAFGESQNLAKRVKEGGGWRLEKTIFAYEPLSAVGTGEPDTPENAQDFAQKLKVEVGQNVRVLYGGSVNAENVKSFIDQPDISGVLVGQASLDAEELAGIVKGQTLI